MKGNVVLKMLATMMAIFSSMGMDAQTSIPIYTIRHNVEQNVVSTLAGHAEWGVSQLRRNIHSQMPTAYNLKTLNDVVKGETKMSPEEIYRQRHESALIFCKAGMCGECPELHTVFIATATPITKDGVCFVNYHMIQPLVDASAHTNKADSIFFVADRDGQCYPVTEILAYSRDDDAAVIKINTNDNQLNAIPLGDSAETGQHVNLITHPKQMFYTYTQGYVTRNAVYNFPGNPIIDMMEISADFAEGSSGGPVMDDYGNLVGMVRATTTLFHDEQNRNTQMVRKTTVPIKVLKRLLKL